jgi:mRNA-degrading endonuclease RelE of RelBE toxin-antitoxin system
MSTFVFTNKAKDQLEKLEKPIREQILAKLTLLKAVPRLETYLKALKDFAPATHRLRIGSYRIILSRQKNSLWLILKIGHRREIYR